MTTGWAVVAGIFGAVLGSFLNVCVHRWPLDQSVISPRSRCPGCGAAIAGYDNIPILSWLVLRGRCRRCAAPISVQYPLVEIAVAAIWAGSFFWLGPRVEALRIAVFLTILLGIALTDARHYLIPDEFSLGGLGVGLAFAAIPGGFPMMRAVLGAAAGFALLWVIGFLGEKAFRKPAMGGGDIKMMAMVGAFVGTQGVFLTMFLGALAGALIFGPISMKTGKLVPFGIFLAVGAAITAVWGPAVVEWYLSTFL
jgi:leader peptidase (prepilin peptidase)/N-methyltransferase